MSKAQQRIAWITGGGTGIGRALAQRLANGGWRVAISGRRREPLEAVVRAARDEQMLAVPLDVTDTAACHDAVAYIEQQFGTIDLAVLNAGIYEAVRMGEFAPESFRRHMETNYLGVVNGIAALLPGFRTRRSGTLAIVSSVAGYRGLPLAAAYGPTKAALINLAESLRFDLERDGIRVCVANPGFVETPLTEGNRFHMPFLMDVDSAAAALERGLKGRHFEIVFPRRFAYLLKVMRCLPYALFFPLMRRMLGR